MDARRDVPHEDGEPGSDSGGEGYSFRQEAQNDGMEAIGHLREALESYRELFEAQLVVNERLAEMIGQVMVCIYALLRPTGAMVEELKAGRSDKAAELALPMVLRKAAVDGAAEDALEGADDAVKELLESGPMRAAKKAWPALWSAIVHVKKVQEWSFGGEVGIPGFAKGTITVTLAADDRRSL